MITDEKLLKLTHERLAKVVDVFDRSIAMVVLFDGNDPIVPYLLFAVFLFAFNDANRPAFQHASGKGGLVHQHEHVDGITIVSAC